MLYFTMEVFRRLANQNRGHIRVMLEFEFNLYLRLYILFFHHKYGRCGSVFASALVFVCLSLYRLFRFTFKSRDLS